MISGFCQDAKTLLLGTILSLPCYASGQQVQVASPIPVVAAAQEDAIPDAPTPQIELALNFDPQTGQTQSGQPSPGSDPPPATVTAPAPPTPDPALKNSATQSSSSAQNPAQPPDTQESQRQKAAEQIKQQEKQRIAGILPSFNVSYLKDAASMTAGQKMSLAFRSATDPYTFGIAFIVAGIDETHGDEAGFKWGPEGYFERSGAAYLDAFDGAMIGNGILPAVLHQDPRYFRLGYGSFHHRLFYAIATSYICKHDNSHRWEPNYSNVGGNIIAGAISNLYYPDSQSGWGQTITTGLVVTTEGTFGGVLQEFWPDISRKFLHKDPTHGLDAQARAADDAEKAEKKQTQEKQNQN